MNAERRFCIALALLATALVRAQDELPKHAASDSLDFEPKLMLEGPRAPHLIPAEPSPAISPGDRVKQLEADLLRAQQRAGDSQQLFKEGVLAKVEMEERVLRVVDIQKDLAAARLIVAAAQCDAIKNSVASHQASPADLAAAAIALKTARETAAATSVAWDKARLDAATLDLQRKHKLYSEGVATRREVQLAEDRVLLLSGTSDEKNGKNGN